MPDITPANPRNRRRPAYVGRLGAAAVGAGLVVAAVLPAGRAAAATSPGSTTANVAVGEEIFLSNLTPSFELGGFPGDQPEDIGAVTMNVETNNSTGYNVTVAPEAAVLRGTGTNPNTIPVSDLSVRETETGTYEALSAATPAVPVTVHNQATRSAAAPGDLLSNDYEFNVPIPNVRTDTYSVILDYVASTNP